MSDEAYEAEARRTDLDDFECWLARLEDETCQEDSRYLEWLEYQQEINREVH